MKVDVHKCTLRIEKILKALRRINTQKWLNRTLFYQTKQDKIKFSRESFFSSHKHYKNKHTNNLSAALSRSLKTKLETDLGTFFKIEYIEVEGECFL